MTRIAFTFDRSPMISSVSPVAKNAPSAPGLTSSKGSTTMLAAGGSSSRARPPTPESSPNAAPNWAVVSNRSAGSFASARAIAAAAARGTVIGSPGAASVTCFTITACAVGPLNGGDPVSSSWTTQAKLYWSLRPSISRAPVTCSGLMYRGVPSE